MLQALADNKLSTHSLVPPTLVSNTGLEKRSATQKDRKEEVRKDSCSAYQVRIGPVAFQGCGDFANDEVVHLLGGLWVVSGEAKSLVGHSEHARHGRLHTRSPEKNGCMDGKGYLAPTFLPSSQEQDYIFELTGPMMGGDEYSPFS